MKHLFLLSLCAGTMMVARAQIVINEVMQSNIDCIMDDVKEFPDSWVELYNAGDAAVNLKDYKIGLTDDAADAYTLPNFQLAAKGYKLVYCDKYEGTRSWHAPFRLDSGKGGSVYLFHGSECVDAIIDMKKQPAPNIAYGRKTDGANEFGYQAAPTPNAANCGTVYGKDDILKSPVFSIPGQVFEADQTVEVSLSLPDGSPEGTRIVFTTDGTEPTASSATYSEPFSISRSTVIRAKLVCDGYLSPRSLTQSYIFNQKVRLVNYQPQWYTTEMTLPVFSLVTDIKYFYDSQIGLYPNNNGNDLKKDWRRPLNIEFFDAPGQQSCINQLGETRVTGGASRGAQIKSLALYANKRFGEKRLTYEFFPEDRPGITEFKSVMLRNAGNDFDYLYMRDAIIQRSFARHVDLDYQGYSPAVVYLNGEYMGMLNIRERSNDDNVFTNYDGLEDIDMFENWGELKAGTWDNLNAFKAFYKETGHTMAEFEQWMDCREFMNLMIMNLFYVNLDFPGNNIVMWRPTEEGGRWRWIAKDTDFGLGLYGRPYNYKIFNWIYNNGYDPNNAWANHADHTRLFRRLMDDTDFRNMFIDHCCIYMGDFLNFDRVWDDIWSPMYERIKDDYPTHRNLINIWWPNYGDEMSAAKEWLRKRTTFFYDHLAEYYQLGKARSLSVNLDLSEDELSRISITMNDAPLIRGTFSGKFHQGRTVRLSGTNVTAWEVFTVYNTGTPQTETYQGSSCQFTMPDGPLVKVNAIVGTGDGIDDIHTTGIATVSGYYDVSGMRHDHPVRGQNIVRMSDGSTHKIIY